LLTKPANERGILEEVSPVVDEMPRRRTHTAAQKGRFDMRGKASSVSNIPPFIAVIVLSLAVGSPTSSQAKTRTHRLYEGPPRPAAEIAILHTPTKKDASFGLLTVDSKKPASHKYYGSGWDNSFSIELLPGLHVLEIAVRRAFGHWSTAGQITFMFQAGHEYEIDVWEIIRSVSKDVWEKTGQWEGRIKDLTAGTVHNFSTAQP
jgi:hypothetical protein